MTMWDELRFFKGMKRKLLETRAIAVSAVISFEPITNKKGSPKRTALRQPKRALQERRVHMVRLQRGCQLLSYHAP